MSNLIREVGEAMESAGEMLADGVVEEKELRITIPKLEAEIRESASLRYRPEELSKPRKKHKAALSMWSSNAKCHLMTQDHKARRLPGPAADRVSDGDQTREVSF